MNELQAVQAADGDLTLADRALVVDWIGSGCDEDGLRMSMKLPVVAKPRMI